MASFGLEQKSIEESMDLKRRDIVNDCIKELGRIIPPELFANTKHKTNTKDGKPTKGQILGKAKDYILQLQKQIDQNNSIEVKLINDLKDIEEKSRLPESQRLSNTVFKHPSAVVELSRIGEGPLAEKDKGKEKEKLSVDSPMARGNSGSSAKPSPGGDSGQDFSAFLGGIVPGEASEGISGAALGGVSSGPGAVQGPISGGGIDVTEIGELDLAELDFDQYVKEEDLGFTF